MFCNKCGNKINDGILFCPKCGNQLATAQAPANPQAVTQPKPVAPQQNTTPAPKFEPKPQPAKQPKPQPTKQPKPAKQSKPVKQPKEEKATPVKKKKKGGKIVLIILALLLIFGLIMAAAIPVAVCGIINYSETHADDVTYIEDFPVLKNQTELYVYDEVKFPVESYDIVIEKFIIGGAIKDICAKSEIINAPSSEPSYELDLADGDYRITLIPNSFIYDEYLGSIMSNYEDFYEMVYDDEYPAGYGNIVDDYVLDSEDAIDDYITDYRRKSVIIIDVKVDGEDENAINAVNLNGQEVSEPVDEPVEEEPDDADKFIDATDADWEEFNTLLPTMYSYDFNCADITTAYVVESMIAELGGVTPLYMYHFEEYPTENYYEITEKYNGTEPDPKGIFTEYNEYSDTTYYNYYKIPKNNVKWLCEEVLNIEFDENYVSEESYVYGDYVYRYTGGVGDASWDEYDFVKTTIVDGKYEIVIEHYFCYYEGDNYEGDDYVRELLSTKQITAKIKVKEDGEKFWSYYEIKEYNSEF